MKVFRPFTDIIDKAFIGLLGENSFPKRQTRREAGAQSHGSGQQPGSQVAGRGMKQRIQSTLVEKGAMPHRRHVGLIVPERRSPMMNHIMQFVREEEGATALEYGLLAALVAAALVGTVTTLGATVSQIFADMNSAISVGAGS